MKRLNAFAKNRPALFAALCTLAAMILWMIEFDDDPIGGFDMVLSHGLTTALTLLLMASLSLLSKAGFGRKGLGRGLLLGIPFYLLGIASALFSNPGIDFSALFHAGASSWLLFLLSMGMVGLAEETLFRGLILNNFLRNWGGTRKGVFRAVWVSAAIFGAIHLLNMAVAPPLTVLVQAINAANAGVLFAAIYIRCRNLWSVIVVHALVDCLALAPQQLLPQATSIIANEVTVLQALLVVLVGSVVPLVIAQFLLRKVQTVA